MIVVEEWRKGSVVGYECRHVIKDKPNVHSLFGIVVEDVIREYQDS